jgi:hypothetical protein
MILSDFSDKLSTLTQLGIYAYSNVMLKSYFPGEPAVALKKTIERAINKGLLQRPCRGVYMAVNAQANNYYKLESIAVVLRSGEYSYISLETALSEFSIISQMTINTLTVMTTGRSQIYQTPYGTIEFTHTARSESDILENTIRHTDRPLRLATPALALSDLKRVRRNLDLVNMETFREIINDRQIGRTPA